MMRSLSLRAKLVGIIVLVSSLAIGMGLIALGFYQQRNARDALIDNVSAQARLMALYSEAALTFDDRRWTYAELDAEVNRVAKGLIAIGVAPGEHVALWMTNRPEWLFLIFAIARVGACIVPLNTRYRTDDVAAIMGKTPGAAAKLAGAFAKRRAQKIYWAIVAGFPKPGEGVLELPLASP